MGPPILKRSIEHLWGREVPFILEALGTGPCDDRIFVWFFLGGFFNAYTLPGAFPRKSRGTYAHFNWDLFLYRKTYTHIYF